MDVLESGALRHFQRMERILGDVKNLASVHDGPETRKLYDLFSEYGGPIHVVLDLAKAPDQKTSKVYQALRDIVCARLVRLSFELREFGAAPGGDTTTVGGIPNVYMYHDISTQWEQVLKVCPSIYNQTINDHFDDLIRELRTPSPSLERLEVVVRRIRYVMDYKLPTARGSADGGDGRLMAPSSTPTLALSPSGRDREVGGPMEGPQSAGSLTPTPPSTSSYVQFNTPSMANSNSAPAGYAMGSANGSAQIGERLNSDDPMAAPGSGDVLGLARPAAGLSGWQDDILRGRVSSSGSGSSMMLVAPGSSSNGLGIGGMAGILPDLPLGASAALSDSAWLPKSDIPRRPFKSRECDFFKQGKCNKSVCNFAHGTKEKDWWTCKYQAVFPCKTVGCLGRTNGCIYAHNPEEQIYSKVQYEEAVNTATGGLGDTGSYSSYGSGAETPSSIAGSLPSMGARGVDPHMHHIHYGDHNRSNPTHSLHQREFRERDYRDYRDYRERDFRNVRDPRDRAIGGMTGSGGQYGSGGMGGMGGMGGTGGMGMGSGMHSGKQWLGKNELPRPFRSKLCEFYLKHGVCTKAVCNYAHDPHEMADWAGLFQTMFRCNNKNCVGREGGCTYSHAPEEQLTNKHVYDFKVDKIKQQCHAAASAAGLLGLGDNGLGSPPLMMHSQSHWTPGEVDLLNLRVAQLSMEHM